jgi:hypothetical protein
MGVQAMVMDHHAADDDVGQLTHRHREKFSLQDLYPAAGEESFHLEEDDGGGGLRYRPQMVST